MRIEELRCAIDTGQDLAHAKDFTFPSSAQSLDHSVFVGENLSFLQVKLLDTSGGHGG
jgi:hypothetical protein